MAETLNAGGFCSGSAPDADALRPEGSRALLEAEQLLASLPTILIGLSSDLHITRWNQMAGKVFARTAEAVCGRPLDAVRILWDWERVRQGFERCRADQASVRLDDIAFVRANGQEGVLGLVVNPLLREGGACWGFTLMGADITERKMLEKQLAQAQKLRSIGQLASGIAHEINTPTQYVGDNIRFLKDAFDDIARVLQADAELLAAAGGGRVGAEIIRSAQELRERADLSYLLAEIPLAIEHTQEGVERISKIVRAMKDFAHPGREEKTTADLNQIIDTTLTVARNEWKYVAEMQTDFDRGLPPVLCLPGEIGQVVLNLVINAAHAIEDAAKQGRTGKGLITIATRRRDGWAEIRISDTGSGIPENIRHRIFDPFFTTKEIGRGTGQGLAICYPVIVEKHGGRVSFDSEVGRGTTFSIELPLGEAAGAT